MSALLVFHSSFFQFQMGAVCLFISVSKVPEAEQRGVWEGALKKEGLSKVQCLSWESCLLNVQCLLLSCRGRCVQRSPVMGMDVSKARRLLLDAVLGRTSVR